MLNPMTEERNEIRVEVVENHGRRRVFWLTGAVYAAIEYDGRDPNNERVLVDGFEVGGEPARAGNSRRFTLNIFNFGRPVPGILEVRDSMLSVAIRLSIGGQVVYASGRFGRMKRVALLPIPGKGPSLNEALPIASAAARVDTAGLPVIRGEVVSAPPRSTEKN